MLLVCSRPPARLATLRAGVALRELDARLELVVVGQEPTKLAGLQIDRVHVVRPGGVSWPRRCAVSTARATCRVAAYLLRRPAPDPWEPDLRPLNTWTGVRADTEARRMAADATVLAAADRQAVYAVWRLARRHRQKPAVYGVDAAVRAFAELGAPATVRLYS